MVCRLLCLFNFSSLNAGMFPGEFRPDLTMLHNQGLLGSRVSELIANVSNGQDAVKYTLSEIQNDLHRMRGRIEGLTQRVGMLYERRGGVRLHAGEPDIVSMTEDD